MNSKKLLLYALISSACYSAAQAQSIDDAVILSKDDNPATARIKSMGNVQTALGGDISSINGNPAGLGFFSRSDISITFDYLHNNNKTNYLSTDSKSKKGNFGVSQVGVVFNFPSRNQIGGYKGWQNFNMGISYNKKQNFNNSLIYQGYNGETSYVNMLTDLMDADGQFRDDFAKSNLVDQFGGDAKGDGYYPLAVEFDPNNPNLQHNDVLTKGNHSNTAIAIGANYNNKLYLGATMGLSFFRYEKSKIFEENGWTKLPDEVKLDNPNSAFLDPSGNKYQFLDKSYQLFDEYSQITEGSGIDLKLGMIYKPSTDWNVGLTLTTPTWSSISETTDAFTDVNFYDNPESSESFHSYNSDLYSSDQSYNITSPWKFALGLTKFFNRGLISAEMEYITYNTIKYSNPNYSNAYDDLNQDIKDNLQGVFNVRVGGEVLLNNILSARAGFNYYGNPYKYADETNLNGSVGLGIKLSNTLYMDLAVVHQVNKYSVSPYVLSSFWHDRGSFEPTADIKLNRTNALLTFGAKF